MHNGIILTGSDVFTMRTIGPYRLRSVCAEFGYKIKVIDFCQWLVPPKNTSDTLYKLLDKYITKDLLFIGISTTFLDPEVSNYLISDDVVNYIKSKNDRIQIIVGGAKTRPNTGYNNVDWAVTGYADVSIIRILDFLTGKSSTLDYTVNEFNIKCVDSNSNYGGVDTDNLRTVWLDEDYIQSHEALPIEISRGCIFKCSFCAYPLNGKKKFDYIRQAENFSEELAHNYSNFGVTNYMFLDDTFNDSDFKLRRINDAISASGVKIKFSTYVKPELLVSWPEHTGLLVDMGLQGCSLGIESFHPKARVAIGKGMNLDKIMTAIHDMRKLSNYTLGTQIGMIIGLPHETRSDIYKSYTWIKNNSHIISSINWSPLGILNPKTNVYLSLIDQNPEKFGYKILGVEKNYLLNWSNEHFDWGSAKRLANYYAAETLKWAKVGGWQPGLFRIVKEVDVDAALKDNIPRNTIKFDGAVIPLLVDYFNFQLTQ
jgi:hypothetical protein